MKRDCSTQLSFGRLGRREITATFDGGDLSSDGGALVLRLAEEKTRIVEEFVRRSIVDHRDPARVQHTVVELFKQRVFGLLLGYEDLNDHDTLRNDALLATAIGKRDATGKKRRRREHGKPLASSSTLNRLEQVAESAADDRYRRIEFDQDVADDFLIDYFMASIVQQTGEKPDWVVIDLDPSDVALHGKQEGSFFHGYYRHYCYLPLYVFCGEHVLTVRLQTADGDPARNAVAVLERIVARIRAAWPETAFMARADSGFCRDELFTWLETHDVDYVIGIARNPRLEAAIEAELEEAKQLFEETGEPARVYKDLRYRTLDSWSRERRVVAKAEHLAKGRNPRFVVTSFSTDDLAAWQVYEEEYCPRGEAENRIKEQQLDLFGARASSGTIHGNQLRFYLSALASLLIQAVRALGLTGTDMARAQASTIRLKLLKVAASVKVTARRVWVRLSSYCPFSAIFARCREQLWAATPIVM